MSKRTLQRLKSSFTGSDPMYSCVAEDGDHVDMDAGDGTNGDAVYNGRVSSPRVLASMPRRSRLRDGVKTIDNGIFRHCLAILLAVGISGIILSVSSVPASATSASGNWSSQTLSSGVVGLNHVSCASATSCMAAAATSAPGSYVSLTPARICDTRPSTVSGLTDQCTGKTLDPAGTLNVQVTGKGGVPATGVSAVVLNVTVAGTTSGGYLTVWPTGEPQPLASNLNWRAGETVPNLVEVGVGTSGQVSFYNSAGSTDLIVDVEGYIATSTTGTSGLYEALPPARICDTRPSTVSGLTDQCTGKTLGPAGTLNVQVTGKGGVPATGVSAVVMNITVAGTTSGGVLTVWPTGEPQPLASNLNWRAGETVANRVIVPVGSSGQVSVYNLAGNADVIIDVTGWYTNGTNTNAVGATFVPIAPARICDTRPSAVSGLTDQCTGKTLGPAGTLNVQVTGKGGVPATGVSAVVMNVTVAGTTSGGFLTVWPAGEAQPLASDINWRAGEIVPNLVVATLGAGGQVSVYNSSGNTDVIIDVVGYLVSAGSAAPSITFTSLPSGTIGKAYTSTLEATGGVTPYTWSIVYGALPGGLSLSAATGTISGTPTTGGTSEFTVQIEDANGNTDAVAFSISIGNPCAAQPTFAAPSSNGPSITTTALVGGTVGLSYRASLAATGGTAPYTWSVVSGCLPQGLVLESSGSIIGTPTTPGLASFLVEATDSASPPATSTQALTIDVVQALAINTPSLLGGVVGVPYSMTLSAYGGVPAEYTWAVSSGSLPPGITLAPTSGLLSGTPTSAGTYNFTLEASENEPPDQSASQSYTITIEPASTPGVVLSPTYAAGANTTYSIYFTLTAALDGSNSSNQGTITLTAPTGTSWPTSACGECYQVNDNTNPNADFADTTSGCCGGGVTLTNNDTVAQIQVQNTLNAGDSLQIVISGVTNPPTANPAETIQVATSSDPSPVTSAPYPITYTSVSQPVVSLSPTSAAGATTTYTIDLTLSAYGTLDGGQQGTITLTAPTGTSWPTNNYSGCRISYQVNDNTNPGANFEAGCYNGENVTLTNNNTVVQIPVWSTLNAGDSLQLVISGVTNPPTANPAETIQVATSSDPSPVTSAPYPITYTSVSQPVVSLSPTSAAGATTTYTIDLTLSAYGTLDGGQQGTITLTAPTGTSWPTNNYSGCRISYQVNDNTNPGANFEAGCYNGENVTLTNNNTVVQIPVWSTLNAGDSLQIVISGVTNPPTANPAETIQVMTSSDPRPEGSLPYAIASS